jgi:hypothetical protein
VSFANVGDQQYLICCGSFCQNSVASYQRSCVGSQFFQWRRFVWETWCMLATLRLFWTRLIRRENYVELKLNLPACASSFRNIDSVGTLLSVGKLSFRFCSRMNSHHSTTINKWIKNYHSKSSHQMIIIDWILSQFVSWFVSIEISFYL